MAAIVGGFGFPHTPMLPVMVAKGEAEEARQYFERVGNALIDCRADVVVMFDTDHLNTFFFDNLPVFAVGVDDHFTGPNEDVPGLPAYRVPSAMDLAAHIRRVGIESDFDLALVQNYATDHSIMVPLHFLTPQMTLPVIPVFIGGHIPPLPSAQRCYRLGQTVAQAIQSWPSDLRVAVMASGSFSLEVCGPRMEPGVLSGIPDPEWAARVCDLLAMGDAEAIVAGATPERIANAGNVAGEILNWIAMLGALGSGTTASIMPQLEFGHAFGVWEYR